MDASAAKSLAHLQRLPDIPVAIEGDTIDEVVTRSPRRSSSASPRGRRPLTPRSAEACLMEGIDPDELIFLPPEHFQKSGVHPEVAKLRADTYEASRQAKLKAVREARAVIVADAKSPSNLAMKTLKRTGTSATSDEGSPKPVGIAHVLLEAAKHTVELPLVARSPRSSGSLARGRGDPHAHEDHMVEMIKRKQHREIQLAIIEEIRETEYRVAMEERHAMEKARKAEIDKELKLKRQHEQREQLAKLERRRKEEERREKEAAAAELAAIEATKHEHDLSIHKMRETRRLVAAKEKERLQRNEEFRAMIEAKQQVKQKQLEERMRKLEEAEAARNEKRHRKEHEQKQKAAQKRREVAAKIKAAAAALEKMEEERLAKIAEKEEQARLRQEKLARDEEELRKTKAAYAEAEMKRHAQMTAEMQRAEEARKQALVEKQLAELRAAARREELEAAEAELRRERDALMEAQKREAVERQRRKEEYKRLITLQTAAAKELKIKAMAEHKEKVIQRRKHTAYEMLQKKAKVMEALEKAKKTMNWKLAEEALGEPLGIDELSGMQSRRKSEASIDWPPKPVGAPDGKIHTEHTVILGEDEYADEFMPEHTGATHSPVHARSRRGHPPYTPLGRLPPIGEGSIENRDPDTSPEMPGTARQAPHTSHKRAHELDVGGGDSEFTLKASALARMLQQAQQDFEHLMTKGPEPAPS